MGSPADIDCDNRAKEALPEPVHTDTPLLDGNQRINGAPTPRQMTTALRAACHIPELRTHMMQRLNWDSDVCDNIDWYTHGKAMHRLPPSLRTFVTKLIHLWLPVQH